MNYYYLFPVAKEAEKISLSVPKLSEEEIESNHIPHHMKCDACLAVAYQVIIFFIST